MELARPVLQLRLSRGSVPAQYRGRNDPGATHRRSAGSFRTSLNRGGTTGAQPTVPRTHRFVTARVYPVPARRASPRDDGAASRRLPEMKTAVVARAPGGYDRRL
ncbi:hypothetical protein Ate01nite_58660 [Actinoplanes teichomyceticus]|nr:hypothetical protein Ate01nite_58660 [Actinoplanes teichomyceticus]